MTTKILNLETLGVRTIIGEKMGIVKGGPEGGEVLGMIKVSREEQQPILTEKEVALLKDFEFTLAHLSMPCKFKTSAGGRRFMSDYDPTAIVMSEKRALALKNARWEEVEGFPQGRFMCVHEGDRCFTNADIKGAVKLEATIAAEDKRQTQVAEAAVAKEQSKIAKAELKEATKELVELKAKIVAEKKKNA